MASNRQMLDQGFAKRADLVKIRIEHIHVEEGFNAPETKEEFEARVEGIVSHLRAGGKLPPVEVRDRPEGGVFLVDGHARREGTQRAAELGIPVHDPKDGHIYLLTMSFVGNDADRSLRIITSADGRTLSPLQTAAILKRLRNFGWSPEDIGQRINRSAERVRQLLALGDANSDVQQMVSTGKVSATLAAKTARKHGEQAGAVLEQQLKSAAAQGKTRVTPATVAGPKAKTNELRKDSERLDFLIEQRAIVKLGGKMNLGSTAPTQTGHWLSWIDDDRDQSGTFDSPREAIDAAMAVENAA